MRFMPCVTCAQPVVDSLRLFVTLLSILHLLRLLFTLPVFPSSRTSSPDAVLADHPLTHSSAPLFCHRFLHFLASLGCLYLGLSFPTVTSDSGDVCCRADTRFQSSSLPSCSLIVAAADAGREDGLVGDFVSKARKGTAMFAAASASRLFHSSTFHDREWNIWALVLLSESPLHSIPFFLLSVLRKEGGSQRKRGENKSSIRSPSVHTPRSWSKTALLPLLWTRSTFSASRVQAWGQKCMRSEHQ